MIDDDLTASERRQIAALQRRVSNHREHSNAILDAAELQKSLGVESLGAFIERHRDELTPILDL